MTSVNVTSEYGKTDSKKENVTENLNRVIVSYLKKFLKYRVNVKQLKMHVKY
jgi:hypothetical protein